MQSNFILIVVFRMILFSFHLNKRCKKIVVDHERKANWEESTKQNTHLYNCCHHHRILSCSYS